MVFVQEIIFLKDGAYVINLVEYESVRAQWIALYVNAGNVTFGVKHIPKEIKKYRNKNKI